MKGQLWSRLVFPLSAIALLSLAASRYIGDGGFFVNLSTEVIGIVVTVAYVDWVLKKHNEHAWQGTTSRINARLKVFVNMLLSGMRSNLGFGTDILNDADMMSGDAERGHREVLRMASQILAPAMNARLDSLDQDGWVRLQKHLHSSWTEAERLIDRFGARLNPNQLELLLDLQEMIQIAMIYQALLPDVAGVKNSSDHKTQSLQKIWGKMTTERLRSIIELSQKFSATCVTTTSDA